MTSLRCTLLALSLLLPAGVAPVGAAQAQTRQIEVSFRFDPRASAQEIYADFSRTAFNACATPGPRSIRSIVVQRECAAELLDRAVKAANRTDIASLHDAALRPHAG